VDTARIVQEIDNEIARLTSAPQYSYGIEFKFAHKASHQRTKRESCQLKTG
jgi:hypothetical protein